MAVPLPVDGPILVRINAPKGRLLWLPICKAGNCSISAAIQDFREYPDLETVDPTRTKLLVVRNPFARLYSFWQDKVQWKNEHGNKPLWVEHYAPAKCTFREFAEIVCGMTDADGDRHWASASYECDRHNFQPDIVFKLEELAELWAPFAESMGLPAELPELNRTRANVHDHNAHVAEYTPELADKVHMRYREDFERFGYP